MINIPKFVKIRKAQKLSQTELCNGICTQSTLSKFENNGLVPSFKILRQLCSRLNISVADIMISSETTKTRKALFDASFAFINFNYTKIDQILSEINPKEITQLRDKQEYNYLRGQLALEYDRNNTSALYYFNNILTTPNMKQDDIHRLLALKGSSEVYASQKEIDKAAHYYDQILKYVTKIEPKDSLMVLQLLSILTSAGEFYGQQKNYKVSNRLLNYAYKVDADNHCVYFLARVLLRLAKNEIEEERSQKTILQHLNDTCAFARLNNNNVILEKARKLLKEYKR